MNTSLKNIRCEVSGPVLWMIIGDGKDARAAESAEDLGENVGDALEDVALASDDQAKGDRGVDVAARAVTKCVGQHSDGKPESERHLLDPAGGAGHADGGTRANEHEGCHSGELCEHRLERECLFHWHDVGDPHWTEG